VIINKTNAIESLVLFACATVREDTSI